MPPACTCSSAQDLEDLAGLRHKHGREFQTMSYQLGVSYRSHTDCVTGSVVDEGQQERAVTFLAYLTSDVEGGETVFPNLDLSVAPRKGTAVLFYNYDLNGVFQSPVGGLFCFFLFFSLLANVHDLASTGNGRSLAQVGAFFLP